MPPSSWLLQGEFKLGALLKTALIDFEISHDRRDKDGLK
uniref:Uncharacterized protein n=1 Tax=Anguilla anguilla TaxID=7936 RepID=A0A0E9RZQ5_ANGAN